MDFSFKPAILVFRQFEPDTTAADLKRMQECLSSLEIQFARSAISNRPEGVTIRYGRG